MALEKLQITPLDEHDEPITGESFRVLFNPTTYSISKTVEWLPTKNRQFDAPGLTFGGGGSRTLTLELFFDVTEPVNGRHIDDVRMETNKLVALTKRIDVLQRPRAAEIDWGGQGPGGSDFPFRGVLGSLTQTFTLFTPSGKPLRANVNVTFTEWLDAKRLKSEIAQASRTYVVRSKDTLSGISATGLKDPARWRLIARENNVDNPRELKEGAIFVIPNPT
jgi:hypothetical protein